MTRPIIEEVVFEELHLWDPFDQMAVIRANPQRAGLCTSCAEYLDVSGLDVPLSLGLSGLV